MRGEPLPVQVATTTFVDDVINKVAHKKNDELAENTTKMDVIIEAELKKNTQYLLKQVQRTKYMENTWTRSNEDEGTPVHPRGTWNRLSPALSGTTVRREWWMRGGGWNENQRCSAGLQPLQSVLVKTNKVRNEKNYIQKHGSFNSYIRDDFTELHKH